METIGENASSPLPQAVEQPSHSHGHPLHAAREGEPIVGLDDQMDVIRLYREVIQAEPEAIAPFAERAEHPWTDEVPAETRKSIAQAQRHMDGNAAVVGRALNVRNARASARPFPPGSVARAAPCPEDELVLMGCTANVSHPGSPFRTLDRSDRSRVAENLEILCVPPVVDLDSAHIRELGESE
jgi:hypothetical protein